MSESPIERRSTHTIRFSSTEWTTVLDQANAAGLRPAVYVRNAALGHRLRPRPTTRHRSMARALVAHDQQLARIGNNLNQLVRLAHSGRIRHDEGFLDTLTGLLTSVDAARDEVCQTVDALIGNAGRPRDSS